MTYAIKKRLPDCVMVRMSSTTLTMYGLTILTMQALGASNIDLASIPDKGGLTPLHHASVDKAPFYTAYLLSILRGKIDATAFDNQCFFLFFILLCYYK